MSRVYDESGYYVSQKPKWSIIDALLGGTETMRAAGETYLPKDTLETSEEYKRRLQSSVLFNALKRTLRNLSGKPFSKPLELESADTDLKEWWEDIDRQGTHGDIFAKNVFEAAVAKGVTYIYVDYPNTAKMKTAEDRDQPITLADQREKNIRPYFVQYHAEQIIGWRSENINGREVATQVRIRYVKEVEDGKYGTKNIECVLVLEPGRYEKWEIKEVTVDSVLKPTQKVTSGGTTVEPKLIEEGSTTLDEIPLVPVYGRKTGFMRGESPLLDVAYLNISHWQKMSDQDTILHAARVPILFGKGFEGSEGDDQAAFVIGANRAVTTTNTEADLKYVEHTGSAIDAGKADLEDLENRMRLMGLEMLVKKQQITATERRSDDNMLDCELASIVRGVETALAASLKFAKQWIKQTAAPKVEINKDFGITAEESVNLEHLYRARQARQITQETYLNELIRRGVISHTVKVEDEISKTEIESPSFGFVDEGEDTNVDDPTDEGT